MKTEFLTVFFEKKDFEVESDMHFTQISADETQCSAKYKNLRASAPNSAELSEKNRVNLRLPI